MNRKDIITYIESIGFKEKIDFYGIYFSGDFNRYHKKGRNTYVEFGPAVVYFTHKAHCVYYGYTKIKDEKDIIRFIRESKVYNK